MEKMVVVEGSYAVAHAVKVCRPNVISATRSLHKPTLWKGYPSSLLMERSKTVSI